MLFFVIKNNLTKEPLAETKKLLNYFDQQRNNYGKEAVSMIYLTN